jgi:Flp pilus assembly protein TadG
MYVPGVHIVNDLRIARPCRSLAPGRSERNGALAIEFAIVLPLLMLLLLGAIDFGRFSHTAIAVANAARSGAGVGALNPVSQASRPAWEAEIRQAARIELEGVNGFDPARLNVAIETATDANGRDLVTVTVTYPFETLLNWVGIPSAVALRQSTSLPLVR